MLTLLAADESVPWWQSVAAATTLLGIIIGVVAKYLADLLTERGRRKREDERRFIDVRRESYARMVTRADAVRIAYVEVQSSDRTRDDVLRVDCERGQDPVRFDTSSAEFIEADGRWRAAKVAVAKAKGSALETIDSLSLLAPANVTRPSPSVSQRGPGRSVVPAL